MKFLNKKGFTLIELLVVISIISFLSSIVMASLNTAREKGRIAAGQQFEASTYHAIGDRTIAKWNLDEGSGSTAFDSSGAGINITRGGTSQWIEDNPTNKGYSINCNNTAVATVKATQTNNNLDTGHNGFTVMGWFKIISTPPVTSRQVMMQRYSYGCGNGYADTGWDFEISNGYMEFGVVGMTSASVPVSSLIPGKWTHVAGTYDGNHTLRIYIDGSLKAEKTSGGTPSLDAPSNFSDNPFAICDRSYSICGNYPFNGYVSGVKYFSAPI